MSNSL